MSDDKKMTDFAENKIESFTKLDAWKQAHLLVLGVYKILKTFPVDERYSLGDQIKRCVVSISSNIAEGYSRQSSKEKLQTIRVGKLITGLIRYIKNS